MKRKLLAQRSSDGFGGTTLLPSSDGARGHPEPGAVAAPHRRVATAVGVLSEAVVAIFVVAILLGLFVVGRHGGGPIQGFDDTVGRWYLNHRGPLVGISRFVATYLDAGPLAVICAALSAVLLATLRSPRALVPLVAYLGGEFQVFIVREVIARPRPRTADYPAPGAIPGVHETSYSYPSGHAVAVTAVLFALLGCAALTYRAWWPWLVALVASLFVADTRLVLGVHFFSDVAFGVMFGIAWGVAVAWVSRRIEWRDLKSVLVPKRGAG